VDVDAVIDVDEIDRETREEEIRVPRTKMRQRAGVKVTVVLTTYNHERFPGQAFDSVLSRQTDFETEIVIEEDCSIDGTREIVRAYAEKCGNLVRPILRPHHVGMGHNFVEAILASRGDYRDRIVNLHPSLLPAFKGLDGFIDAYNCGARFFGCTVELVDQRMDEGKIVLQASRPLDRSVDIRVLRHSIFVQTCKAALQTARWLWEGRVRVAGRSVTIEGANFTDPEFSPALDFDDAKRLEIPFPGETAFPARLLRMTRHRR